MSQSSRVSSLASTLFRWHDAAPSGTKAREVVRILERPGFVEVRQRGSHKQFRQADGRSTTVPLRGRGISPVLLRQICKDIGPKPDEFIAAQ